MSKASPKFDSSLKVILRHPPLTVIDAIYYPGTGDGYWLSNYTPYGMLAEISERRGMGFDGAPLTEQGTITAGTETRKRSYDYMQHVDPPPRDAPEFKTMTETWEGMTDGPAVTRD